MADFPFKGLDVHKNRIVCHAGNLIILTKMEAQLTGFMVYSSVQTVLKTEISPKLQNKIVHITGFSRQYSKDNYEIF